MEVVKPWEEVEVEVEDKEVALRGRLPRQQSNTTTTVTTSKVGDESSDKASESSSDEEVNGTRNGGVSNGENGGTLLNIIVFFSFLFTRRCFESLWLWGFFLSFFFFQFFAGVSF